VPDLGAHARGPNPDQHLVVADLRLFDLTRVRTSDDPYRSWVMAFIG
jgi:hypothetical protein